MTHKKHLKIGFWILKYWFSFTFTTKMSFLWKKIYLLTNLKVILTNIKKFTIIELLRIFLYSYMYCNWNISHYASAPLWGSSSTPCSLWCSASTTSSRRHSRGTRDYHEKLALGQHCGSDKNVLDPVRPLINPIFYTQN